MNKILAIQKSFVIRLLFLVLQAAGFRVINAEDYLAKSVALKHKLQKLDLLHLP